MAAGASTEKELPFPMLLRMQTQASPSLHQFGNAHRSSIIFAGGVASSAGIRSVSDLQP